jgi:hypothetical protein
MLMWEPPMETHTNFHSWEILAKHHDTIQHSRSSMFILFLGKQNTAIILYTIQNFGWEGNNIQFQEVLLEMLLVVQPLKNFPGFYGTRRFITMFTR